MTSILGSGSSGGSGSSPHITPGPPDGASLTNHVEFVLLNSVCSSDPRNQFDIIKFKRINIKNAVCGLWGIHTANYIPYIVETIGNDFIHLKAADYHDTLQRKTTYFIISQDILQCITDQRLFQLYTTRQGDLQIPREMPTRITNLLIDAQAGYLLTEDEGFLLLEDGGKIVLE